MQRFSSFAEFYPYTCPSTATLPAAGCIVGSALVMALLALAFATRRWLLLLLLPVIGYGFAWIGHYFFEHNRPATFTYPVYSFLGDWAMFRDMLTGRIDW